MKNTQLIGAEVRQSEAGARQHVERCLPDYDGVAELNVAGRGREGGQDNARERTTRRSVQRARACGRGRPGEAASEELTIMGIG